MGILHGHAETGMPNHPAAHGSIKDSRILFLVGFRSFINPRLHAARRVDVTAIDDIAPDMCGIVAGIVSPIRSHVARQSIIQPARITALFQNQVGKLRVQVVPYFVLALQRGRVSVASLMPVVRPVTGLSSKARIIPLYPVKAILSNSRSHRCFKKFSYFPVPQAYLCNRRPGWAHDSYQVLAITLSHP